MLYHSEVLGGGFLGVVVFFTLSGFLITSLLLAELRSYQSVDLRAFWRRRVFRIVPLLSTVSVTLGLWGWAHGGSVGDPTVDGTFASLLFTVNRLVASDGAGAPGALTANWSVALEEQFYLVWPLVLWPSSDSAGVRRPWRWSWPERPLPWRSTVSSSCLGPRGPDLVRT